MKIIAFFLLFVHGEIYSTLSNGLRFPMVGFGTAGKLNSEPISAAIVAGYELLDSAQAREWYDERACGKAIRESSRKREDLFITTKLHPRDHGTRSVERKIKDSLSNLQTDYIDGFLLHYPRCWGSLCEREPEGTWKDSWRVLEDYYNRGILKSIGVSNFRLADMKELLQFAKVEPHFIQIWQDPFHQDRELLQYCKENDIQYQAYSSLGTQWHHMNGHNPVFGNKVLKAIAQETGKSVPQVVLKWQLQEGVAVIPRSSKPSRIQENRELDFTLNDEQMERIRKLDGTADKQEKRPPSISMTIRNQSNKHIDVKYEDRDSGTVDPGTDIRITTYDTHRWRFFVEGQLLREFRIRLKDGKSQTFTFTHSDVAKLEL